MFSVFRFSLIDFIGWSVILFQLKKCHETESEILQFTSSIDAIQAQIRHFTIISKTSVSEILRVKVSDHSVNLNMTLIKLSTEEIKNFKKNSVLLMFRVF